MRELKETSYREKSKYGGSGCNHNCFAFRGDYLVCIICHKKYKYEEIKDVKRCREKMTEK